MEKRILRQQATGFAGFIDFVAAKLRTFGYVFGALFVGCPGEDGQTDFALIFRDGMPQAARMQLLEDMQKALDASKESLRI